MKRVCLFSTLIVLTGPAMAAELSSETPTVEEIADRSLDVYQQAKYIHMEGRTVTSKDIELRYVYDGTPDSLRNLCYKDGKLLEAFAWHGGRVQEFVPRHPKRLLLEYDAERDCGIGQRVYPPPAELTCLYGTQTVTWIGSKIGTDNSCAYPPKVAAQRMREGDLLQSQTIDGGHTCYVVEWQQQWPGNEGATIVNTWHYYVDTEQYVIRRMDADYKAVRDGEAIDGEQRRFIYDTIELSSEPREIDWDLWPLVRDHVPPEQDRHDTERQCEIAEGEANPEEVIDSR